MLVILLFTLKTKFVWKTRGELLGIKHCQTLYNKRSGEKHLTMSDVFPYTTFLL